MTPPPALAQPVIEALRREMKRPENTRELLLSSVVFTIEMAVQEMWGKHYDFTSYHEFKLWWDALTPAELPAALAWIWPERST